MFKMFLSWGFLFLFQFTSTLHAISWMREAIRPDGNATLMLGNSAQPPTYAHGFLLANLQGIFQAKLLVYAPTKPYKTGVEPNGVALDLARVSVSHFNEILDYSKIHYEAFESDTLGESHYVNKDKKKVEVLASPIEFQVSHFDYIAFMRMYLEQYAQNVPSHLLWISGLDSFEAVKTWDIKWKEEWKEFFTLATWVIVSRKLGGTRINLLEDRPLEKFDEELSRSYPYYRHLIHGTEHLHIYQPSDPARPPIYFLSLVTPDISSTKARKFIVEGNDGALSELLQPSVVSYIKALGLYFPKTH